MKISPSQIEHVTALPGPKRYAHFIKVAADQNRVWGLYANGWALAATDSGQEVFPVWPAPEYARLCSTGPWVGFEPREISLTDFFHMVLPTLRAEKTLLGVFFTPTDQGVVPGLDQVESDLKDELGRIE